MDTQVAAAIRLLIGLAALVSYGFTVWHAGWGIWFLVKRDPRRAFQHFGFGVLLYLLASLLAWWVLSHRPR